MKQQKGKMFNTNQLAPNDNIYIKGVVKFSRVAKIIEGEELQKKMQNELARRMQPITVPHTEITIKNAQIIKASSEIAGKFIQERMFITKDSTEGVCFKATSKSKRVPVCFVQENNSCREIKLENELATGNEVIIKMKVFKASPNNGVGLDAIIVNGEPQYIGSNMVSADIMKDLNLQVVPVNNESYEPRNEFPQQVNDFIQQNDYDYGNEYANQDFGAFDNLEQYEDYAIPQQQNGSLYSPTNDYPDYRR